MRKCSRKKKLALWLLILPASLLTIVCFTDWPSPTAEIAFRREEKGALIGPSEIIASIDFDGGYDSHMILGRSDYGYTTFEYSGSSGWEYGVLHYYPMSRDVTLFCTNLLFEEDSCQYLLPIFALSQKRSAMTGEMQLTISTEDASVTRQLSAQRENNSYFLFALPGEEIREEAMWLVYQVISGNSAPHSFTGTVEMTISFFDVSGQVVDTYSRTVTK